MIVVDANVVTYFVLRSEQTSLAVAVAEKDPYWCAPRLWRSELLNVLSGYIRRETLTAASAFSLFEAASLFLKDDAPVDERLILELVGTSNCTSYDCEYVATAQSLRVPLVTADKQLIKSFPEIAVSMKDFVSLEL
ncbi:MAG: type II toxin-antitoxin system VapC family toxin [Acidobacteria bacterium]|nr:type II toxin-antitoxin system VapC family toxin [Acidobacteriota bacterium]